MRGAGESGEAVDQRSGANGAPRRRAGRGDGARSTAGAPPGPHPQCLQVVTGRCPGPASCVANAGPCVPPVPCAPPPANNTARSVLLTLPHQGFAGHPGALAFVPAGFDPAARAVDLVVFVHGFHNCVSNCALPAAAACNCSAGGDHNQAYGLIDSFAAAAAAPGAAPALFLALEVAYDQASSDPGAWAQPGLFAAFLADALAAPALTRLAGGPRALSDVRRVRAFSHSGGYEVLAALATVGNVSAVTELVLLDSLYGSTDAFDGWVRSRVAAAAFGPGAGGARFASLYTDTGGTEANNRAMAARVAGWLAAANATALMLDDDTLGPLRPGDVGAHPIIFKRSPLTHDDTCRAFFAQLLQDSF